MHVIYALQEKRDALTAKTYADGSNIKPSA
jgi:hypothetical protein